MLQLGHRRRPFAAHGGEWATKGFSIIELVVVIVVLGILAVVALPRFSGNAFDQRGFHDAAKAALQHARHVAIASRRFVRVEVTAGTGPDGILAFAIDTEPPDKNATVALMAAATPLVLPIPGKCAEQAASRLCAPAGVSLAGGGVIFDPRGVPVKTDKLPEAAVSVTINADPALTIQITPETGWIQ